MAAADEIVAAAPEPKTIGIDGVGVVPVGDYANAATFGVGALARIEIPAGPGDVTGRGGVIFHAMNDNVAGTRLLFVPLYAGYRYRLGPSGAYLAGELGVTLMFASVDTGLGRMTASANDSKLGLTLMGGWRRGALDLRGGLFAPDVNHAVGLMFSAGWDFARF